MQIHHMRVGLTEGTGRTVIIFTENGKNREGLDSFSVSYNPGLPQLYLQYSRGDSIPFMVKNLDDARLLYEASREILARHGCLPEML